VSLEDLPEDPFALDPVKGTIILAVGAKGTGKSVFTRRLYLTWPYDKLAIDVNGDADPGEDAERLHELGTSFPVRHEITGPPKPRNLHYRADPGSPTYRQDLDKALGMALRPSDRKVLVWCDEFGEVSQANRTQPNARRLLMQSRHYGPVSALFACPRPMNIDPLAISQADGIAIYNLPNPRDRQKLAENMGLEPAELDEAWRTNRTRGKHAFLYWHQPSATLIDCPPLPYP
jgi:hypothetical protein